jgi:hypothetical protein
VGADRPDGADAHEQRLLERQEAKAARSAWITSRTDDCVTRFWIQLHFTATSGSWVNLVGLYFAIIIAVNDLETRPSPRI